MITEYFVILRKSTPDSMASNRPNRLVKELLTGKVLKSKLGRKIRRFRICLILLYSVLKFL